MSYEATRDMTEFLFAQRTKNLPPSALAEVFDRLIWCMSDNGSALLRIREEWLMSDDKDRIEIALMMDETFPFKDANQMKVVFSQITSRWPDLAPRCTELLQARARAMNHGKNPI